jgi:hypothetical protein
MRLSLTSGPPWHLSCTVESIGPDGLCRIHGGDVHVGAVVLAQWVDGRAVARPLVVRGHKEEPIATHAALELCRARRWSVVCVAGIHFDDIDRAQIEEISRTANDLARRAAEVLASSPADGANGG